MAEISLQDMIRTLPPELQGEVHDFVAFLLARQAKKHKTSRKDAGLRRHRARRVELSAERTVKMRFEWQGALKEMREKYTSVELQHRISDARVGQDEASS